MKRFGSAVLMVTAIAASGAGGAIPVGAGSDLAEVVIEFKSGATYTFDVSLEAPATGLGLLDIIEAGSTLTTVRLDFGFGEFVDGISYDGNSNAGWGGGDDWWHYYTYDNVNDGWVASMVGASDRIVGDGDGDGWVYGREWPTVPEPCSAALILLGASAGLLRRRRRKA